jgi:hypothetical protein
MEPVNRIEYHCTLNKGLRGYTIGLSATIGNGKRNGEKQVGVAARPFRFRQLSQKRVAALLLKLQRDVLARHQFYNNTGG